MADDTDAMLLMKALISKMESMDAELTAMRKSFDTPEMLLKRAGFVRAITPQTTTFGATHSAVTEIRSSARLLLLSTTQAWLCLSQTRHGTICRGTTSTRWRTPPPKSKEGGLTNEADEGEPRTARA